MKIELNKDEVKHAVIDYLKTNFHIEAAAKDITLNDSYSRTAAIWEPDEEELSEGERVLPTKL